MSRVKSFRFSLIAFLFTLVTVFNINHNVLAESKVLWNSKGTGWFKDQNLAQVVADALQSDKNIGDMVDEDELKTIIALNASDSNIEDLSGIERLHALYDISIEKNRIYDLSLYWELIQWQSGSIQSLEDLWNTIYPRALINYPQSPSRVFVIPANEFDSVLEDSLWHPKSETILYRNTGDAVYMPTFDESNADFNQTDDHELTITLKKEAFKEAFEDWHELIDSYTIVLKIGVETDVSVSPTQTYKPSTTRRPVKIKPDTYTLAQMPLPLSIKNIPFINGYPDHAFKPDGDLTRAEACQMLYKLTRDTVNQNISPTPVSFTDIPVNSWYTPAVSYLINKNIINGYPNNTFKPDDQITRAEFVELTFKSLMNYADKNKTLVLGDSLKEFNDLTNHWSYGNIKQLASNSFVNGYNDKLFHPDSNITRAEAVVVLVRSFRRDMSSNKQDNMFNDIDNKHWAFDYVMNGC